MFENIYILNSKVERKLDLFTNKQNMEQLKMRTSLMIIDESFFSSILKLSLTQRNKTI